MIMVTIKIRKRFCPGSNCELPDFRSKMWPFRLFSDKLDQSFELPITWNVPGEKPSLQAIKPAIFILYFHDTKTLTDL